MGKNGNDRSRSLLPPRRRLRPPPLASAGGEVAALVATYFNAYNAARLREACQLLARAIEEGATIGLSLSGALTPAGLSSVLTPMMQKGWGDYVSSTAAGPRRSPRAPPTCGCARTASSASTTCSSPPTSSTRPTSG